MRTGDAGPLRLLRSRGLARRAEETERRARAQPGCGLRDEPEPPDQIRGPVEALPQPAGPRCSELPTSQPRLGRPNASRALAPGSWPWGPCQPRASPSLLPAQFPACCC